MTRDTRPEFQFLFPGSVVSLMCLSRKGKQQYNRNSRLQEKKPKTGFRKKQAKKQKPNEPTRAHSNCQENNDGKGSSVEPCSSLNIPRRHTKELYGLVLCRILPPADDNPPSGEPCSWKCLREAQKWCGNKTKLCIWLTAVLSLPGSFTPCPDRDLNANARPGTHHMLGLFAFAAVSLCDVSMPVIPARNVFFVISSHAANSRELP